MEPLNIFSAKVSDFGKYIQDESTASYKDDAESREKKHTNSAIDLFQPRTSNFSTCALILVYYKVVN